MPEWQYSKLNLNDPPRRADDIDMLNEVGRDGWELVGITGNNVAYLKRAVPQPEPPPPPPRKTTRSQAK